MSDLVEKLRIRDAVGHPLATGSVVRSTGYETPFTKTLTGTVIEAKGGPPTLAVRWDDDPRPFWHAVDLMWRCMDVRLADNQDTKQGLKGEEE